MPNAKVVGPPQAGAFKERKSGKFLLVHSSTLSPPYEP